MRVFEFHFSPQLKPDLIFDSFCYEPENIYEKRVGSLYMVGVLKNALPQNLNFLDKLAKIIQKEYYRSTARKPEKALKESLVEANEFLEKEAKKGDVSWLGNLSFAVLSLSPPQKFGGRELNFTKVGDIKIFLLRKEKIIDIDRKVKFEDLQPWPLKVFGNIILGKLAENDIILVLTKEVNDFFAKENLLPEIGKIWPLEEKKLKAVFDNKKEEILKISGACLFVALTKEVLAEKRDVICPESYPKEFNLKEVFSPLFVFFKKIKSSVFSWLKEKNPFKLPKIKLPMISSAKFLMRSKKAILVLSLICCLVLGFLISQFQQEKNLKEGQAILNEIQGKVNRAESLLLLQSAQAEKEAGLLIKESWKDISRLADKTSSLPEDFQGQLSSLKNEISKKLFVLNKLEVIEEPKLLFEFDPQTFIPQKTTLFGTQLYFFSPYSNNLFKVSQAGEGALINKEQKFDLAVSLENSILFFSKPNQIINFNGQEFSPPFFLQTPYPDYNFNDLSSFGAGLYFLDKDKGQIIKYPYLQNLKWDSPRLWLTEEEKVINSKSITIDGLVWILQEDNSLSQYYQGRLQKKFVLDIFPEVEELKKFFTSPSLPYIYILEPIQKRIIIINKEGEIIKQFQSEKFDNLLDFAVSGDGEIIFLLNGLKVYQINI